MMALFGNLIGGWKLWALFAVVLAVTNGVSYFKGKRQCEIEHKAAALDITNHLNAAADETEDRQDAVADRIASDLAISHREGEALTRTLLTEIGTHANSDDTFVPVWFVCVLDLAARADGDLSGTSPGTGGTACDARAVEIGHVANVTVENYGTCNGYRDQLIAWQEWYRGIQQVRASQP